MSEYLLDEIIDITKDSKSINFWKKAIDILGEHRVEMELGELKHQMRVTNVENPAKYLTTLLKKQMKERGTSNLPENKIQKDNKTKTYFENTQRELFKNLQPVEPTGMPVEEREMSIPYGKTKIPWTTFIDASFFTLSTNKAKSDKVLVKFRSLDGNVTLVPIIRGKSAPNDTERGILTAQHAKILGALKHIWTQQDCKFYGYTDGIKVCHCYVSVKELAGLLGWKKFGGSTLKWLYSRIYDLKVMPYYIDLSNLKLGDLEGYGFTLLKDVTLVSKKQRKRNEYILHIEFSVSLSIQLLKRHAVTRSKTMLMVKSELATLLQLYLEPILFSVGGQEFSKQLKDLIIDLKLPEANWHKYPATRKREFEKVIKQVNGILVSDEKKMFIKIEKGLYDYMLIGKLVESYL